MTFRELSPEEAKEVRKTNAGRRPPNSDYVAWAQSIAAGNTIFVPFEGTMMRLRSALGWHLRKYDMAVRLRTTDGGFYVWGEKNDV